MPRNKAESLTDREAQIMGVLWQAGSATADEIRNRLPGDPHDSTVRTLLRVMEQKGLITHGVEKRAYVYRPRVAQHKAQRKAVRGLLQQLFGGSVKNLVSQLLDDDQITPEELQRLAREARKADARSRQGRKA